MNEWGFEVASATSEPGSQRGDGGREPAHQCLDDCLPGASTICLNITPRDVAVSAL